MSSPGSPPHDPQPEPSVARSSSGENLKVTETTSSHVEAAEAVDTPTEKPEESAAREGDEAAVIVDNREGAHDPVVEGPAEPVKNVTASTSEEPQPTPVESTPVDSAPAAESSHQLAPPAEPIRPLSQNSSQNSSQKRSRINISKSMQNLKKRKGSEVKTRGRANSLGEKDSIPPVPSLPGRPTIALADKSKTFSLAAFLRKLTGQSSEKKRSDKKGKVEEKKVTAVATSKAVKSEHKVALPEAEEVKEVNEAKEVKKTPNLPEEMVAEDDKVEESQAQAPSAIPAEVVQSPVDPCQIPLPPSPLLAPVILEPVIAPVEVVAPVAPVTEQHPTPIDPRAQAMLSLEGLDIAPNAPRAARSPTTTTGRTPAPIRIPSNPILRVKTPLSASSVGSTVDEDRLLTPVESRSSANGTSLDQASVGGVAGRVEESKLQPRRSHSPPKSPDMSEMGMMPKDPSPPFGLAATKSKSWRRSMINLSSPLNRRATHKPPPPTSHEASLAQQQCIKLNRVSCQPVVYRTGAEAVRGKMASMGMREEDEEVAETFFMS
ncbi:hypothetical protein IAR50_005920 [Cryptococcus sp. DSM 104548]